MATQIQAVPAAKPRAESEFQTGQVLTIVGGHFVHDTYTAFVPPLLPLIIEKLSLSLTQAGSLWGFLQLPALLNPFIGYLADRLSLRYFVILAPAVTATLISLLGLAPNYWTLAILLFGAGISVAAFHAPAPPMVARMSGERLGKGMSWFMAGGESGRTVGPLVAVAVVSWWSLDGFYRIMVVGWLTSLILYWRLHHISARPERPKAMRSLWPAARRLFLPLLAVNLPRQVMLTALEVYLPTLLSLEGSSLWMAGASLSIWEVAGIGGALTGGTLSDRIGRKTMLLIMMSTASLLMLLFLQTSGWLMVVVLLAVGFTALSVTPVMLAMVQEHLPENRALANGLFMSMTFAIRPVAALAIGFVGDHFGLRTAFLWAGIISLTALPMIFLLPQLRDEG